MGSQQPGPRHDRPRPGMHSGGAPAVESLSMMAMSEIKKLNPVRLAQWALVTPPETAPGESFLLDIRNEFTEFGLPMRPDSSSMLADDVVHELNIHKRWTIFADLRLYEVSGTENLGGPTMNDYVEFALRAVAVTLLGRLEAEHDPDL